MWALNIDGGTPVCVLAPALIEIPTLDPVGMVILLLLLGGGAAFALRRGRARE